MACEGTNIIACNWPVAQEEATDIQNTSVKTITTRALRRAGPGLSWVTGHFWPLLPSLPLYAKHKLLLWECALPSGNEPDYQHFVQQPRMLVARYS